MDSENANSSCANYVSMQHQGTCIHSLKGEVSQKQQRHCIPHLQTDPSNVYC